MTDLKRKFKREVGHPELVEGSVQTASTPNLLAKNIPLPNSIWERPS
jgi:hypothetical protein